MIKIALAGNPNSGKTTVFNSLSGKSERIGNWAGVTVSKKEAPLKRKFNKTNHSVLLIDLPGAYSMDAYTNDELEATKFIRNENIDVIINVVDASNLERSLLFTKQLIATEIPVVMALNKSDITKRRKTRIDIIKLSELLKIDVIFTQATSRRGLQEVIDHALKYVKEIQDGQETDERRHQRNHKTSRHKRGRCH